MAKVVLASRVSGGNLPQDFSVTLNITYDFSGCSDDQVRLWAAAERRIAVQRVLRDTCKPEFLKQLATNGLTIHATECGKRIRSREDRIDELVTTYGWPKRFAILYVDDPEQAKSLMKAHTPKQNVDEVTKIK